MVCGVHGHNHTMKFEWPAVAEAFWDELVAKVMALNVMLLAGDFNMCFTEVVAHLRSRGVSSRSRGRL